MLAKLFSVTLEGIKGTVCEVEVDVSRSGFDKPMIVGLPDAAVKESVERVRSAITNSGFKFPDTQSVINLAPADIKKVGPAFDLPIALGMLGVSGNLQTNHLSRYLIVGELALDGRVRSVNGVLSMAMAAAENGFTNLIVPLENAAEAAVVQGIEVYGVASLAQAVSILSGELPLEPTAVDVDRIFDDASAYDVDFSDVKGQESVKRALTIAAAGGHNVMMIGTPGVGKTLLAERLASIMPPLTLAESLETTQIYSSVGMLDAHTALIATRPFRAPHHTASGPALIGGGTIPRPGELSLAHHGILFLDEFAEFPRHVLEMIRQPLEGGMVTISRAKGTITFPAQFVLVAAMNPCPCGYYGMSGRKCKCTPVQIDRYMSKISGPLLDRIDIHVEVPPVSFGKLRSRSHSTASADLKRHVIRARQAQARRFGNGKLVTNSMMTHKEVEKHCVLDVESELLLKNAMTEFALSVRAHDKICKIARTLADLEGCDRVGPEHIAEAISYRKLDRKL